MNHKQWVSRMSGNTDELRDIFLDVAGEETLVEPQEETPSHDPVEERDAEIEETVSVSVRNDGLDDAVDSGFGDSSTAMG